MEVPSLVEPLDKFFAEESNFRVLWARHWKNLDEHINIKECRVALSSLKRASRVAALFGLRKLTLSDNLATVCAISKGRSSTHSMNRLCQTAAAIQFGCGIVWHLRHIESKRNVADKPSKVFERKHLGIRRTVSEIANVEPPSSGLETKSSQSSKQGGRTLQPAETAVPQVKGKFFLELFSGTGRLTEAVRQAGTPTLEPLEIANGLHCDLRRRQTQRLIIRWIEKGLIGMVHLGTPCTIWSKARHNVKESARTRAREEGGLELALFSCEVIQACNRCHVHYALENPATSKLFNFEPLQRAIMMRKHYVVTFDMCSYGEPYKKDTKVVTSLNALSKLERHCSHRRHAVWLKGQVKWSEDGCKEKYVNRTKLAGAYPQLLCKQYAQIIAEQQICFCHGASVQCVQDNWAVALRSYQAKANRPKHCTGRACKQQQKGNNDTEDVQCQLLEQAGGLDRYFDWIAHGRAPQRPVWKQLKTAKKKASSGQ